MQDKGYPGRKAHQQMGFTLIEILVVIVIIGVTLGFAMMAFGDFGKERKITAAAEEFTLFLTLIHERALLESSTLKLNLSNSGYSVQRMGPNHRWQSMTSSFYKDHQLPSKTQISVSLGSHKIDQLSVTFSGSGDMSTFKVYFGTSQRPRMASVTGSENGTVMYAKERAP